MATIEMQFSILGSKLFTDHAYGLYSAISHYIKEVHTENNRFQIGPVLGQNIGNGKLQLDPRRSRLRLRMPAEDIPSVLPLAGKVLDIAGNKVRLGVPQVQALTPAPNLIARMVTIKKSDRDKASSRACMEPDAFLAAARRQLDKLGIQGKISIPLQQYGPRAGQPRRQVLRIKGCCLIGYALQVSDLTTAESVKLLENGLGGKKKMGCGFFVATREEQP